jgi:hemolysin activation/secretion protein
MHRHGELRVAVTAGELNDIRMHNRSLEEKRALCYPAGSGANQKRVFANT